MGRFLDICREWLHMLTQHTFHYTCPVCRTTVLYERGICPGCIAMLETEAQRICPRCRHTAPECTCVLSVPAGITLGGSERTWIAHTFYNCYEDGVLCKLLHNAKKEYKTAMYSYMASTLAEDLMRLRENEVHSAVSGTKTDPWRGWCVSWIPRSSEGYARYGFDQGEECAAALGKILHIPAVSLFFRASGKTQKTLNAAERRENAEDTLHLRRDVDLPAGPVLLYDDVITTGASMTAAVLLLAEEGVTKIFPVAFARTVRRHCSRRT